MELRLSLTPAQLLAKRDQLRNNAQSKIPLHCCTSLSLEPPLASLHSSPLQRLPSDILQMIFEGFNTSQRVRILTVVCRQWRNLVLRMPTSLLSLDTYHPNGRMNAGLIQLARVTELRLCRVAAASIVPAQVRSLIHTWPDYCEPSTPCRCNAWRHVTGVTNLELVFTQRCHAINDLLLGNRTSITCLSLGPGPGRSNYNSFFPTIGTCYFPNLRSLEFAAYVNPYEGRNNCFTQLLALHSTQLLSLTSTYLSSSFVISIDTIARFSYPQLTHFVCRQFPANDYSYELAALLRRAPRLRSVELRNVYFISEDNDKVAKAIIDSVGYLLTTFRFAWNYTDSILDARKVLHMLSNCTNLRTVVQDDMPEDMISEIRIDLLERLTKLGTISPQKMQLIPSLHLPHLRALTVTHEHLSEMQAPLWILAVNFSLPLLQKLKIRYATDNPTIILQLLDVISACPMLRTINVFGLKHNRETVEAWLTVLKTAERAGIDKFEFNTLPSCNDMAVRASNYRWMRVVTNNPPDKDKLNHYFP